MIPRNLHEAAFECLLEPDPARKIARGRAVAEAWGRGELERGEAPGPEPVPDPGRPAAPELVAPGKVPRRGMNSAAGRRVLAHALAHIEFNAINICWDAVYRFRDRPDAFYTDWMRVAVEEGRHFELLEAYLRDGGEAYGRHPAHGGLWETVRRTDDDVLVRMALVPRVLEARGLDVTPRMQARLRQVGDERLVSILDVIYEEEKGHVLIGTRWFRHACDERGLEPRETFRELLRRYMQGRIKGPYDELGRMEAGFTRGEIDDLKALEAEFEAALAATQPASSSTSDSSG